MKRLQFLLKQAEIYSHFITSDSKASKQEKGGKRKYFSAITDESTNEK